ncbi:MAG TPA: sigma 54 modulation/S30EA ribosomal C-terminal domain-containing protein [Pseudonocardia sp.]|jgi:hypothetical protein|nr:sigma 54 modulation/S30EA ribosomal C-terminal domain-containing protein [Pseudonocardia sp.]
MTRSRSSAGSDIDVQVTGPGLPAAAVDYARERVGALLRKSHEPVLHARVRIIRHPDPARDRPAVAQANLDVNGRPLRAQVSAPSDLQAVDALVDALNGLLTRSAEHWEALRARRYHPDPHEWRHGDPPRERRPWFPRPPEEREIVRHKTYSLPVETVDEAAMEMDDLGYDFHLFTELGSGQDSVLYRAGPTGYRLAQGTPRPDQVQHGCTALTVSEQAAPTLGTREAISRLELSGQPFVFYLDAAQARGRLLYHRYDGHYGLITPAE